MNEKLSVIYINQLEIIMINKTWVLLGIILIQSGAIIHYQNIYANQIVVGQQLQSDNERNRAIVAAQSLDFNLFNKMANAQQRALDIVNQKTMEKNFEYRTILNNEPTCDLAVPTAITNRLFNYANRLRADALHTHSEKFDSADTGASPSPTLTYCQAILWIDPLIAAIERANRQLAIIRDIEDKRTPDL